MLLHLDESANSTIFTDNSGQHNNASCISSTCPASGLGGQFGSALQFADGTPAQYLRVPNSFSISPANDFSLSAWINLTASGQDPVLMSKQTQNGGYTFQVFGGKIELVVYSPNGVYVNRVIGGTVLQVNTWYHVAAVFSNGTIKTYVNGALDRQISSNAQIGVSGSDLFIGRSAMAVSNLFKGKIDEIQAYNRALSDIEIQTLASGNVKVPTSSFCLSEAVPSGIIDVTSYGASNKGDSDATAAIQNAVNSAPQGGTVYFPAGTYRITSMISLRSNLHYLGVLGQSVIRLQSNFQPGYGFVLFNTELSPTQISIHDLYLVGGGIGFTSSVSHLDLLCNVIEGMTGTPNNGYDNNGLQTNLGGSNLNIVGNKFQNSQQSGGWNNWGALVNVVFDHNFCDNIRECFHTYGQTGQNVSLTNNLIHQISRMGFEVQSSINNLLIQGNYMYSWRPTGQADNPACSSLHGYDCDSFGISIAMSHDATATDQVLNNVILGTPGVAWALEHTSDNGTVKGNTFTNWTVWLVDDYQRGPLTVTNNQFCGGASNSPYNNKWYSNNSAYQNCSDAPWFRSVPAPTAAPF